MALLSKSKTPTTAQRLAAAEALSTKALGLFDQAALDLENAAAERSSVADELAAKAASLRVRAAGLDTEVIDLDGAAADDLYAAERIRSLFA